MTKFLRIAISSALGAGSPLTNACTHSPYTLRSRRRSSRSGERGKGRLANPKLKAGFACMLAFGFPGWDLGEGEGDREER
jgi:hypothetical protein